MARTKLKATKLADVILREMLTNRTASYFTEGVISYSVIQGDIKDTGYDGQEEGGILVGGIGQLCDGRHGVDQPFVKSM